jgi:hypothetical protein
VTPEAWAAIAALVDRYGLPLAILGGFLFLLLRGKLVTGGQLAQLKDQLATMTMLFERERSDRMAAEANVAKFASANAEVAEAVREALTEVVKGPDAYAERLAGPPRRAR